MGAILLAGGDFGAGTRLLRKDVDGVFWATIGAQLLSYRGGWMRCLVEVGGWDSNGVSATST